MLEIMPLGAWVVAAGLIGVLVASIPTTWEALRDGNAADPLGREINEENERVDHS